MTPAQVELVQESFRKVVPIAGKAAEMFYDRLFEIAPETRPLFRMDLTSQYDKLVQMLVWVVANLRQIDSILAAVEELGRRHARYEVEPEHYDRVGEALIWTLEKGLGPAFTPEVRDAWIAAYGLLATAMKDAARTPAPKEGLTKPMLEGLLAAVYGAIGWQDGGADVRDELKRYAPDAPGGNRNTFWWR